jgi:hypothetical protein
MKRLFALIGLAAAAASAATVTPPASPGSPSLAPGPRPPAHALCKGFGMLLPIIDATWGKQGTWHSADFGSFGDNVVWVFKLVVPVGTPTSTSAGSFTIAEFLGPNTPRQLTISKQACDFRMRDFTGATGPLAVCQDGTSCQISYAVQTPTAFGGIAGLAAGQTYYVNARNWSNFPPPPAYDCGQTTCNAIMNLQPATP